MTSKFVNKIHRTGTITSPFRQLIVTQGAGRDKVETVLGTPIEKVSAGVLFRHGAGHVP